MGSDKSSARTPIAPSSNARATGEAAHTRWSWLAASAVVSAASACSLGNFGPDECPSDSACEAVFGLGSVCSEGYCSEPASCNTGHDCRTAFAGGACVEGTCRGELPASSDCPMLEPEDLATQWLAGPDAPFLVGGILSLADGFDQAQSAAARLAVREINRNGGIRDGRKVGLVLCDNGGPGNTAEGADREQRNRAVLDHLAGTLGTTAIIGPFSSSDALVLIGHELNRGYPTVIVSPSATSPQLTDEPDRLDPDDPVGLLWRTCASDVYQGQVLAEQVVGVLPEPVAMPKVAVVHITDAYGQGLSSVFREIYEARDAANDAKPFPYDSATDLSGLAAEVDDWAPDALLIVAVVASDAVAILNEMATTDLWEKPFYFTDGSKDATTLLDQTLFDPDVADRVRAIIQAGIGTAPASPEGAAFEDFDASLQESFDVDATAVAFLANTYDAGYVVGYGIVYASSDAASFDGRDVAAGLARLAAGEPIDVGPTTWASAKSGLATGSQQIDILGISGPLDFDAQSGEAPGPIEIWGVEADLSGFTRIGEPVYPGSEAQGP